MPEPSRPVRRDRDARRLASEAPWLRDDIGPLVASTALGVVGLVAGYLGASSTVDPSRQFAWMTATVVMTMIAALGNALWLGLGRRSVRARRDLVIARLRGDAVPVALAARPAPVERASRVELPSPATPRTDALVPEAFLSYLAAEESE